MELAQGTSHSHDALLATEAKLVRFAFGHFGREGGADILAASPPTSYEQLSNSSSPLLTVHMYNVHVQNYVFLKNAPYVYLDKKYFLKSRQLLQSHIQFYSRPHTLLF
jgi:hypothetical protein